MPTSPRHPANQTVLITGASEGIGLELAKLFATGGYNLFQANDLGVNIQADIIKQKLATNNGGYAALNTGGSSYGKFDKRVYTELTQSDEKGKGGNPIELCRYQLANCYMGRSPLINSGGESKGASDLADAVKTAVINKRAGGAGLISGRKAFQRPMNDGAKLLHAIQDIYLDESITIA